MGKHKRIASLLAILFIVLTGLLNRIRLETTQQISIPAPTVRPTPLLMESQPDIPEKNSGELFPVVKVVDGDTITVMIGGVKETVRLIGIDTPEVRDPREAVECFGAEASEKAKELLGGKSVRLESDPSQGDRDRYGRLLRFVFLPDGTNAGLFLIQNGYGHEYTYNLPYIYKDQFEEAEREAREKKLGLWADGVCE